MKILVVNRNYFITGGPEKYMFSLIENMPEHKFMPFCVNFSKNEESPYGEYFIEPPGGPENIYFNQFRMSIFQKIRYGLNMIYSFGAKKQLEKMILETNPDVVFFLNAVYFTDSIIDACKKFKIPVVWRLSDFNKICANYLLFREGQICEDCVEKGLWCILKNKCGGYQKSFSAAMIKTLNMYLSKIRNANNYISYFITPSGFTKEKMVKAGFNKDQIVHIPTFVKTKGDEGTKEHKTDGKRILYVGRLSPEKGVDVLIDAFSQLKDDRATLSIAGDINSEYAKTLIASTPESVKERIEFLGFKTQEEIKVLFEQSLCFIVPSVWYENQPNVVLEGMAYRRTAIVSRLGSLSEMVMDGVTGHHFDAGNAVDLAEKIDVLLENPEKALEMGKIAQEHVETNHSIQGHINALNELFLKVVQDK